MGVRGYIDGVVGGAVVGWACDVDAPSRRLQVSGTFDGSPIGPVRADEPRGDLFAAGIGDGSAGFRIPLGMSPGRGDHTVSVVVVETGQSLPLVHDWFVMDDGDTPIRGATLDSGGEVPGHASSSTPSTPPARDPPMSPKPAVIAPSAATEVGGAMLVGSAAWLFSPPRPAPSGDACANLASDIETVHVTASELGAAVVCAAVPSKLRVYAEHAPGDAVRSSPVLQHEVAKRLIDSDVGHLLDLGPVLIAARTHGRVFPRTGSEVSWLGAHHAARAVVKQLAWHVQGLRPTPAHHAPLRGAQPVEASLAASAQPPRSDSVRGDGTAAAPSPRDSEPGIALAPDRKPVDASILIAHGSGGGRIATLIGRQFSLATTLSTGRLSADQMRPSQPDAFVWLIDLM